MLHYLTIGFLDADAVRRREARAVRPLPSEIRILLDGFLDQGCSAQMMEGGAVEVRDGWVRCPWHAPRRNRAAERFAAEASRHGCTVADVEHGRIVDVLTLEQS